MIFVVVSAREPQYRYPGGHGRGGEAEPLQERALVYLAGEGGIPYTTRSP